MQDLDGCGAYFTRQLLTVVDLVEVDISDDDSDDWQTVPDVTGISLYDEGGDTPSRFTVDCANVDRQFCRTKDDSSYYNWLIKGKRVRLAIGIRKDDTSDKTWQFIIGRIADRFVEGSEGGSSVLHIVCYDFLRQWEDLDYTEDTYWGSTVDLLPVADQSYYDLTGETTLTGIFKVQYGVGTDLDDRDWDYDDDRDGLVLQEGIATAGTWTDSFTGYWKFEDDYADSSGNGNTGTGTGTTFTAGKVDQCVEFGAGDTISCGTDSSLEFSSGAITLEAWASLDSHINAEKWIIGRGTTTWPDYNYGILHDNKLFKFTYRNAADSQTHTWTSSGNVWSSTDTWYHIVFTFTFGTGGSAKLWVNGVDTAGSWTSGDGTDNPYTGGSQEFFIGDEPNDTSKWDGWLDEVAIYDYILSEDQVDWHYNSGTGRHYDVADPDNTIRVLYFEQQNPETVLQDLSDDCNTGTITYVPYQAYQEVNTDGFDTGTVLSDVELDPADATLYALDRNYEDYPGPAPTIYDVGSGSDLNESLAYDVDADGNLLTLSDRDLTKLWQGVAIAPEGATIQKVRLNLRMENTSNESGTGTTWTEAFGSDPTTYDIGAGTAVPWTWNAGGYVYVTGDDKATKLWTAMAIPDGELPDIEITGTFQTGGGFTEDFNIDHALVNNYNYVETYSGAPAYFDYGSEVAGFEAMAVAGGDLILYQPQQTAKAGERGWKGHAITYDEPDATSDNLVTFTWWVDWHSLSTVSYDTYVGLTTATPDGWDDGTDALPNKNFTGFRIDPSAGAVQFYADGNAVGSEDAWSCEQSCTFTITYNKSTGEVYGWGIDDDTVHEEWTTTMTSGLTFNRFGIGYRILTGVDARYAFIHITDFTIGRGRWADDVEWYLGVTPDDSATLGAWGVPDKAIDFLGVRVKAAFTADAKYRTNPWASAYFKDYWTYTAYACFNDTEVEISDTTWTYLQLTYNELTGAAGIRWSATGGDIETGTITTGKRYLRWGMSTGGDVDGTECDYASQFKHGFDEVTVKQGAKYYEVQHYIGITDATSGTLQAWGKPPAADNFMGLKVVWNNTGETIDTTPDIYAVFQIGGGASVETLITADYDNMADLNDLNLLELQYNTDTGDAHVRELAGEWTTTEGTMDTGVSFIRLGCGGGGDDNLEPLWQSESTGRITNVSDQYDASGTVTSQIFDLGAALDSLGDLSWLETVPIAGTEAYFQTRTSDDPGMAGAEAWKPVGAPYLTDPNGSAMTSTFQRYLQYRLTLTSSDKGQTATVTKASPQFTYYAAYTLDKVYALEGDNYLETARKMCQAINCRIWLRYDGTLMVTAPSEIKLTEDYELLDTDNILSLEDSEVDDEYFDYIQVLGDTKEYRTYTDGATQYTGKKVVTSATKTSAPVPDNPEMMTVKNDFITVDAAATDIADNLYIQHQNKKLRVSLSIVDPIPFVVGDTIKIGDDSMCFNDTYMTDSERKFALKSMDIQKNIAPVMTLILVKPEE